MFVITLLTPFLFIPFILALDLTLPDGPTAQPNSMVTVAWTQDTPSSITLVLDDPNGHSPSKIAVNAKTGSTQFFVGGPGTYVIFAQAEPEDKLVGTVTIAVQQDSGPTSTPQHESSSHHSVPSTSTSATSRPTDSDPRTSMFVTGPSSATTSIQVETVDATDTRQLSSITSLSSFSHNQLSSDSDPSSSSSVYTPFAANSSSGTPGISSSRPSPSSSESSPPSPSSHMHNSSMILGSIFGSLVFLLIVAIIILFLWRRKRSNERPITFHRDLMVRKPGPSLFQLAYKTSDDYGVSPKSAAGKEMYVMVSIDVDTTISSSESRSDESVDSDHQIGDASPLYIRS